MPLRCFGRGRLDFYFAVIEPWFLWEKLNISCCTVSFDTVVHLTQDTLKTFTVMGFLLQLLQLQYDCIVYNTAEEH